MPKLHIAAVPGALWEGLTALFQTNYNSKVIFVSLNFLLRLSIYEECGCLILIFAEVRHTKETEPGSADMRWPKGGPT